MARSKLPRNLSSKEGGKKIVTVVPLYDELVVGTLKGVLELAKVDLEEFLEFA